MEKITESSSPYHHLEQLETRQLLEHINTEDQKVPLVLKELIPQIESLVEVILITCLAADVFFTWEPAPVAD